MRKLYSAVLLILLLPILSNAQSNYKPGYVVTLKGDTLHGFIDYQEWGANPTTINFKTDITLDASKKLGTGDISFFNVDNAETYQKYTGRISQDRVDEAHINEGKDTSFKIASVFLKILQKGDRVTLFYYVDGIRPHFYIIEGADNTPKELLYSIYIVEDEKGNRKTKNENGYRKQLYLLAQKLNALTDDMQIDIQRADYQKSDILKVVSKINNINEAEYSRKSSSKKSFNWFVTGGVNMVTTQTAKVSPFYVAGGRAQTSYKPTVSFGIDLYANPNTAKLFFRMEIGLAQAGYSQSYTAKVSPYTATKASFDELWLSFNPQVGYNLYNGENFKVYMAVGISFAFYHYSNAFYGNPGSSQNYINDFPYNFNPADTPIILKVGVQFSKRFGIYADYISSSATTRAGIYALTKTATQIGVKYSFK